MPAARNAADCFHANRRASARKNVASLGAAYRKREISVLINNRPEKDEWWLAAVADHVTSTGLPQGAVLDPTYYRLCFLQDETL